MMCQHFDVFRPLYCFQQGALDFCTGYIFVMNDPVFCMTAFTAQFEIAICFHIETGSPVHKFLKSRRSFFDDHFYHISFIFAVAGTHGIFDMFFEIIFVKIGNYSKSALRIFGIAFVFISFGDDDDFGFGHLF